MTSPTCTIRGANVAAHTGKWDFNASAWASLGNSAMHTAERTDYTLSNKQLTARSEEASDDRNGGATLGAVVSINDRHSLGAEVSYMRLNTQNGIETTTDLTAGSRTNTASRYAGSDITDGYDGTFNYIWKIDTLGSTFKVLGDYAHRNTGIGHRNRSLTTGEGPAAAVDSLYRDRTRSSYDVAALTLALEKNFSPRWSLRTGAKYTRNEMRNDALYEYSDEGAWVRNDDQSFVINYTEHITAAYGVVTANLGRWSLAAGLRGEYTHTYGRNDVGQDYFSLFPNANLSWQLSKERGALDRRPVCPHDRTAAVLVPHAPAHADLGLHLPDRKPAARPRIRAGYQPDARTRPQIHPHGRRGAPEGRNQPDDTRR